MSDHRLRLVGWEIRPVVMLDDGENLTSVQIAPQIVPASAWQAFKDGGDSSALEQVREQIETVDRSPEAAVRSTDVS